jgi:NitT/TauT family transport system ATP-binding protein
MTAAETPGSEQRSHAAERLAGLAGEPPSRPTGRITARGLGIDLGRGTARFEALHDVSFDIEPGEFVCLLGPSGCGKSTLLGALAGLVGVSRGALSVDARPVDGPDPERGLVFQHHTLFPWLRVADNVAYGLRMRGVPAAERRERAARLLEQVGLSPFARHYPTQLSGGMQQRVEIARVLINEPRVLLMDEPFGALDALTRLRMQELLIELWAARRATVVFVTHDIDEALFLADRVFVLSPRPGRLIDVLLVPATRPRGAAWLTDARFGLLKRHCLDLLRTEAQAEPLSRLSPIGLSDAPPSSWRFAL